MQDILFFFWNGLILLVGGGVGLELEFGVLDAKDFGGVSWQKPISVLSVQMWPLIAELSVKVISTVGLIERLRFEQGGGRIKSGWLLGRMDGLALFASEKQRVGLAGDDDTHLI